ncbi:heterogeneous nuclear ribonucleoprotein A0-like [Montipora capricornis]|uniref:heterogeneous nuclear ribonucleoprotein A0-like n=1 Tax=Montipora foliosa TaxID=591990 RepID=UPI0035F20EEB
MATEGWEENPDLKKLYVAKLKPETTNDTVTKYFSNFGAVIEAKIVKDNEDKSRGFAFVTMSDHSVVDTILEHRPHTIDGQTVFLRRAIPKDDPNPLANLKTKKLFIGGLNEEASEEDIKSVLSIFTRHPPEQVKLMRDKNTNKFKGYAFVIYHSEDIVDKLFIIRNATIKNKKVELKKAEEMGGPGGRGGAGGRGRGGSSFRGGRGGGPPRSGGGAGAGGYSQEAYSGAYEGYDYSGSGYGGYDPYGNGYAGYGGYSGYGGGYGYYSLGEYNSEASGYGPNRRGGGRGRGAGGGGGYRPY